MKKVILATHGTFGINGTIGTRTYYVAEELHKQGYDVTVFARDKNASPEYPLYVVPAPFVFLTKVLTYINRYVDRQAINGIKQNIIASFFRRYLKRVDLSQPVLFHSWEFFPKLYEDLKKTSPHSHILQDIPIALSSILPTFLSDDELWMKKSDTVLQPYITNSFKYIDSYLAPSPFVEKSLRHENIPKSKIDIVPFGVDIKAFKPQSKKRSRFKVAFIGNVNFRKGMPYLIQAWKELQLKNAELNLYGPVYPEIKPYLKDAKKYNINVHGFVENKKVLAQNTVYVMPSLMEGSSKTNYEAMACGLPVITTEHTGSIITHNKEGKIVPIKDVQALKEALMFFYNSPQQVEVYGKRGRKKVEKYTWDHYAKNVVRLYKKK